MYKPLSGEAFLTKLVYQHRLSATGCSYQIQIIAELHDETIHISLIVSKSGGRKWVAKLVPANFPLLIRSRIKGVWNLYSIPSFHREEFMKYPIAGDISD